MQCNNLGWRRRYGLPYKKDAITTLTFGKAIMRFRIVPAAVFAVFVLLASFAAQAANPAFALAFRFDPPFTVSTPTAPVFYLDVCENPDCGYVVKSITLECSIQPVSPNASGVVGCMAQAVSQSSYPDPNMGLLNHPMNLRIRANNMKSQIFSFPGGQPALPEVFYNFVITPGIDGFSVSLG